MGYPRIEPFDQTRSAEVAMAALRDVELGGEKLVPLAGGGFAGDDLCDSAMASPARATGGGFRPNYFGQSFGA